MGFRTIRDEEQEKKIKYEIEKGDSEIYDRTKIFEQVDVPIKFAGYKGQVAWNILKDPECPEELKNEGQDEGPDTYHIASSMEPDEMSVSDPNMVFQFQEQVQKNQNWQEFRGLPYVNKVADALIQLMKEGDPNSNEFQMLVKQTYQHIPTLWAYFGTLPSWARTHPLIQCVFLVLEFSSQRMSMRQKEKALNFSCTALFPIDHRILEYFEFANTCKLRLNDKLAKQMIAELPPKPIDIFDLNSTGEDHKMEEDAVLSFSIDDEDDSEPKDEVVEEEESEEEEHVGKDQGISDFLTAPYPDIHATAEFKRFELDYYDNDDGFWDEWIAQKQHSYIHDQNMMTGRTFFKH